MMGDPDSSSGSSGSSGSDGLRSGWDAYVIAEGGTMIPERLRGDAPNVDAVRCRGGQKLHSDLFGTRKAVPCVR